MKYPTINRERVARYSTLVVVVLLITLMFPNKGKFKYEYQRGRPWLYETLVAPVDFPILKSTTELRAERERIVADASPHYNKRTIDTELLQQLNSAYKESQDSAYLRFHDQVRAIYKNGVVDQKPDSLIEGGAITVVSGQKYYYLPNNLLLTPKQAYDKINSYSKLLFGSDSSVIAKFFPAGIALPNLIFDNALTQKTLKEMLSSISPSKGIVYAGQLIVSNGEIVTVETEQLLDSYKAEYELSVGYSGSLLILKVSHLLIAIALITLFIALLYFLAPDLYKDHHSLNFLLLLFILVIASTVLVMESGNRYLYLLPYSVIALYLYSFFSSNVVIPLYSIILMPIIFIASGGFEIYFINLIAGSVGFYTFRYWNRGWLQFVNSFFIFASLSLIFVSFRLLEEGSFQLAEPRVFLFFMWNALLVIAAYPFLFLFEKIFSLVSNSRLRDLSDATNPLLARLALEAPGTFQHSLQVASLAESVAQEIGANSLLTRVGALYHDIGKLYSPTFFIENIPAGEINAHKSMTPQESAKAIVRHVEEGIAIAKKIGLPKIVSDFILTHHGKSQTLYFYNQFINSGGDPAEIDKFTYGGMLPQSKEHVIVMLSDAVEAAARSMANYSPQNVSALVDRMISERVSENQLIESQVTLGELSIIATVLKNKLSQFYHGRISYPQKHKRGK